MSSSIKNIFMKRLIIIFFFSLLSITVYSQSLSNAQFALEQINLSVKQIEKQGYEIYKIQLGGYSDIQLNINEYELRSFPYNDTIFVKAISIADSRTKNYKNSNLDIVRIVKTINGNKILTREIVAPTGNLKMGNETKKYIDVWDN